MKSVLTFLTLFLVVFSFGKPQVYFNYNIFYTPEKAPFITTSLQFVGGTFKYKGDGTGNLGASVEITQVFSKNDSIVMADKYVLDSPVMKDSIVDDFYDVQRYALKPGIYNYELTIKDLISGQEVKGDQLIEIQPLGNTAINMSGVEFIQDAYKTEERSNFTKNGFFILPYLTNYFPPGIDKIAFYTELYNTQEVLGKDEPFLITCSITDYISGKPVPGFFKYKRMKTAPVNPAIMFLPIDALPSGDYNLMIHLVSKNNDTIFSRDAFFQRRNDQLLNENLLAEDVEIDPAFRNSIDRDSIPYFLGSIMPISKRYDNETIRGLLKKGDTTLMENYFFAFWKQTNPLDPQEAWSKYREQVYYTEKLFGTQIKRGYEADRGRVYLQYGAPNAVADRPNEPSAYPYQIWHYYRIGQLSNVRFVFYNPDLVTNDYPLLHSDMRGELQNPRWQNDLHKRNSTNTNLDDPGGAAHHGGTSEILYNGGM